MNHPTQTILTLILFALASSVQAHLTGSHAMGIAEGLHHLITEPSHWFVLILALAAVGLVLISKLGRSRRKRRF